VALRRSSNRVGILGAGAQGLLFGWHLASVADVTYLDIRAELCEVLSREGVRLKGEAPRKVSATTFPSALYDCSVIFIFVKAYDTLRALRPFGGRLDPSTSIVSLQNGLGNEEAVKAALGSVVALVIGATTEAAVPRGDGVAVRIGTGRTVVGGAGAAAASVEAVAALLTSAGLATRMAYDIRPHVWGKLVANAAINPLSAVLDCEAGAILDNADAADLARAIALEAAAVANRLRINLPFADAWGYVREIVGQTASTRSSMALDLAAGRRSEIEQINGAIVAAGRRSSTPTPYNEAMLRLVKARESLLVGGRAAGDRVCVEPTARPT
jgi:2-dehydropantoate 2-reductase